jgi:ribosomal protein S26
MASASSVLIKINHAQTETHSIVCFAFAVHPELVVLRQAQHRRIKQTARPELVEGWFDRLTTNGKINYGFQV